MNVAFLDWSLDIDCPRCGNVVDLVQYDADSGDNDIANMIFRNRWDHLEGYDIECPRCKHDFKIDRVEY